MEPQKYHSYPLLTNRDIIFSVFTLVCQKDFISMRIVSTTWLSVSKQKGTSDQFDICTRTINANICFSIFPYPKRLNTKFFSRTFIQRAKEIGNLYHVRTHIGEMDGTFILRGIESLHITEYADGKIWISVDDFTECKILHSKSKLL